MNSSDIVELAFVEIWRRVIEPVQDEIPDPGVNFEACVMAMSDRVERTVCSLPNGERDAYVLEKARDALQWCKRTRAPDPLTKRVRRWLKQCEAR